MGRLKWVTDIENTIKRWTIRTHGEKDRGRPTVDCPQLSQEMGGRNGSCWSQMVTPFRLRKLAFLHRCISESPAISQEQTPLDCVFNRVLIKTVIYPQLLFTPCVFIPSHYHLASLIFSSATIPSPVPRAAQIAPKRQSDHFSFPGRRAPGEASTD